MNQFFPAFDSKKTFAQSEEEILQFWEQEKVFERSITSRYTSNQYVFFDGPPFATGTPHYGHILAGTLKDAIPRYQTMKGKRVYRTFGWDCHGVPVEFQVEKEKQIGGKPGIEAMGVGAFNELCRSIVLRCRDEWEHVVRRMGRFVDFKNDYKTMDPSFMESVWWVFGELWAKGLIYEGEKVVAYSPKLGSPLSNFEASQNYKDIDDPAVTVAFSLEDGTKALAWTTTPWTLPSNMGLGFGRDHFYVLIASEGEQYWIAEAAATRYFGEDFQASVVARKKGIEFLGTKYTPLFPWFKESNEKRFLCIHDKGDYVSTTEGTGIVHFACAFGAEDAEICQEFGMKGINPINESGYFTSLTPELEGKYFREDGEVEGSKENNANDWVIQNLKERGLLFRREQIRHSYPHCWRTNAALMYRSVKTWFVNVQKIKALMLEKNQEINWIPENLRDGRFGKILEGAPDWAISRNRYWGCPIPLWRCDKTGECQVVTSQKELETLCGKKVDDLHKHFVDELTWKNPKTGGVMRRIPEVLDCWFESGSMPYASIHYPFEAETRPFQNADFIAEGIDQTRGWFYTLQVLGCALFGEAVYKNVITNGIVLAEDGQKMSKSKKNYPDPQKVFDQYGADSMRFYLLSSPVARGENLRFSEKGVQEVLKSVLLPLQSAYNFFSTYANIDGWKPTRILYFRHGEADHNVQKIYSGLRENEHHLTEKGKVEVEKNAKTLPPFEALLVSPFVRTEETADIIQKETGFSGERHEDKRLSEPFFGNLEGQKIQNRAHRFSQKEAETMASVYQRSREFFEEIQSKYPQKTVVVVSHGDIIGATKTIEGGGVAQDLFGNPIINPAEYIPVFPFPKPLHELDQWILSELQTLIKEYRSSFDAYDLERGLRLIPEFIDQLNNWYLRRSRSRFWAPGLNPDKISAYETVHQVLLNLAKLIAPVCPFFAEKLYQDLTGLPKASVHLELFPFARESKINPELEKKTNALREIVKLASSIRGQKKIKLRQPLQSLQFATSETLDFTPEDLQIVAEEANIKSVKILTSLEGIAEKILKVDARMVGKKFGGKTQAIINAGKSGQYKCLEDGRYEIAGEILEASEVEFGFLTQEGLEAASSRNTVVILETALTEDLITEGWAREIIRSIQELRKESGFQITDRIGIYYQTDSKSLLQAFTKKAEMIQRETLGTSLELVLHPKAQERIIEDEKIFIALEVQK